jgi:hypothetical protein
VSLLIKYALYLLRWQLSTPILAIVLILLSGMNTVLATVVANLIGGLLFFWVDKYIFKTRFLNPLWEIKDEMICADCGVLCTGYRLVKTEKYDRLNDPNPEFRCEKCSQIKSERQRKEGVLV